MRFGTPPHEVADDQYSVFYVQIPQFLAKEPDLTDDFDCWIFTIWKSHELRKKPQEVVEMYSKLKEFSTRDVGFAQFCSRFDRVAADDGARKEYIMWLDESIRQRSIVDSAVEDAVTPLLGQLSEKDSLLSEQAGQLSEQAGLLSEQAGLLSEKDSQLSEKDSQLSEKDSQLSEQAARIAELEAKLAQKQE
jgi:chromosome segregation ATPase